MPYRRTLDARSALLASAIACALPWRAAEAAWSHPALATQSPDDSRSLSLVPDGKLPPDTQNFPVLPGVKQFIWDQIYYNTSTCEDLGPGKFQEVVAPKEGKLTYSVQKREIHDGECAGTFFNARDVFYTWTGSGSVTDYFQLHFVPPDGSTGGDFYFTGQLATTSVSWYVMAGRLHGLSLDNWMLQEGGAEGAAALASGTGYGSIVLDFGDPTVDGKIYGATGYSDEGLTTDQIATAVVKFAQGYAQGTGGASMVTLIVGTNNDFGKSLTTKEIQAHARAWSQMVQNIRAKTGALSGISVVGGIDAEVGFKPRAPGPAEAWVDSYSSDGSLIIDFGDAQGCPPSGSTASPANCDFGWTQADIRHVSWSNTAMPLPEIYSTGGGNAKEWQQIALYVDLSTGGSEMVITGPLTQFGACSVRVCKPGTNNMPQQGWDQLWNDLDKDTHTTLYPTFTGVSTDITWRQ